MEAARLGTNRFVDLAVYLYSVHTNTFVSQGGWWFTPKNYKSNVLLIGSSAALFSLVVFQLCRGIEHNPKEEYPEQVIDRWNKAAASGLK
ncbi:hypothetical protein BN1211_4017 [Cyberlindnera jadinii]|uniref:Uncharacterized protein n=1 Tax=Cyberlindnera jadinii (strain ATCC 18201 / CBS 1600 / BCRC 20928 / JCM 3617 / NBRC 0987 / NRRL Y-1542) TaxID=983966 RepID=A0A0H5C5K9_CYBJN|nr:hypothetical protein BN1211_4017 [Cyberlindnera jadinii]